MDVVIKSVETFIVLPEELCELLAKVIDNFKERYTSRPKILVLGEVYYHFLEKSIQERNKALFSLGVSYVADLKADEIKIQNIPVIKSVKHICEAF